MRFLPARVLQKHNTFKEVAAEDLDAAQREGWSVVAVLQVMDTRDNVLRYRYLLGSTIKAQATIKQLRELKQANAGLTRDLYVHQRYLARIRASLGQEAYDALLQESANPLEEE